MQCVFFRRFFLVICLLAFSCERDGNDPDPAGPADPRDKYVGKYNLVETISCYGPCFSCYSQKDTVMYVTYGKTDSTISFLGGDFYLGAGGCFYGYHLGFCIQNDSLYYSCMSGGLGCGAYIYYIGGKAP